MFWATPHPGTKMAKLHRLVEIHSLGQTQKNQQPTPGSIKNHTTKRSQNRSQYTIPMATAPRLRTASREWGAEGTWGRVGPGSPGHGPAQGRRGSSPPSRPVPSPRDRVGKDLEVQQHPTMCGPGGPRGEAAKPADLHRLLTGPIFPESWGTRLGARPARVGELGRSQSGGGRSRSMTRQGERCPQPQVQPAH